MEMNAMQGAVVGMVALAAVLSWLDHLRHVKDQDTIRRLRDKLALVERLIFIEAVTAEKRHVEAQWDSHEGQALTGQIDRSQSQGSVKP